MEKLLTSEGGSEGPETSEDEDDEDPGVEGEVSDAMASSKGVGGGRKG